MSEKMIVTIGLMGGTGQIGPGLARRWASAGYRVLIGSRQAEKAEKIAGELNRELGLETIQGFENLEAASQADICVLTVKADAHQSAVTSLKEVLQGKIMVDTTARVDYKDPKPPAPPSAAKLAQEILGPGVRVVAAFQTIPAHKLKKNIGQTLEMDVLVCSDDVEAAEEVIKLAQGADLNAYLRGQPGKCHRPGRDDRPDHVHEQALWFRGRIDARDWPAPGMKGESLTFHALPGLPLVKAGDDLTEIILGGLARAGLTLEDGDVLILAQKIVSKAEGRQVDLRQIQPSPRAHVLAGETGKDPRLVEVILSESASVLRQREATLIVEHRLGFVCANAGVDRSNVDPEAGSGGEWVLLLPADPDHSAQELREKLQAASGAQIGVLIIDSHGRAWRMGTEGVCIGAAGFPALLDLRGKPDLFGEPLKITQVGLADEIAAGASALMGQAGESRPVIHLRGLPYPLREGNSTELLRPAKDDLFR